MAKVRMPKAGRSAEHIDHECNALVIVGANGSGKSRLGIYIEDKNANSHRISAQRSLVFKEHISVGSSVNAKTHSLYGPLLGKNTKPDYLSKLQHQRRTRWGGRPESHLLEDFNPLLSLLVTLQDQRNEQFTEDFKLGKIRPGEEVPSSPLDRSLRVWQQVMPQRTLKLSEKRLLASRVGSERKYSGLLMSDGERVAFYLIAQAICAPVNSLLIIDEPEIHLHKAIQSQLWDAVEAERSDCTFVYITHDLEFAVSRARADIIWVREFDGENWNWENVNRVDGFPKELTLEILGSRQPVLFVEGTRDSIDTLLYSRIYSEFHIIAREGCTKVIESTIALREAEGFHTQSAMGVIDRDFRADEMIVGLEKDGVYVTPVAEAENVFCLPCVVKAAAKHWRRNESEELSKAASAAFNFLQHQLDNQIKARAAQEIRHALSQFSSKRISSRNEFEQAIDDFKDQIDPGAFYDDAEQKYQSVIATQDYEGLLRLFNNKGLVDTVAKAIGFIDAKTLCDWVIAEIDASLTAEKSSQIGAELLADLKKVFPTIPIPQVSTTTPNASSPDTRVEEVGNG